MRRNVGGRGSWENDPQLKASRGCWASGRPDFVNTLEGLGVGSFPWPSDKRA